MSDWSNSGYQGEVTENWYHGKGTFTFPNGVIYEGEFWKGEFHGEGTLIYPNGGRYKAKWNRGKMIEGDYYFNDSLKYEVENWDYLTEDRDRRFFYERTEGFDPYSLNRPLPEIPEGTYDVGDGYYEPVASIVYTYKGQVLRTPSEKEVEWVIEKCRYNPRKKGVLGGEHDKVIKKAIEKSNEPIPKVIEPTIKTIPAEADSQVETKKELAE
eukprot:CAMPEP_0176464638 /NCGR_PEP_ID=MMETSP0127-20121128/36675_1 /TAXON_ID=938130 /ORGANISM="Platyophrya macrostoma, Strain WH" /LENGTH=211 /DNA_ID=CAMNT_0017857171 /DNA_START=14 /DNA_END=649 /DNA_ORIENTATION=-